MNSNLIYGLLNDEIVTIEEVESGLNCNCTCPKCGVKLIAKKGNIREHHFSHFNSTDCFWRGESLFHKIAKEIIQNSKKLKLPKVHLRNHPEVVIYEETTISIDNIILEKKINNFIPDIIIETKGKQLLIEIFYQHGIGFSKQQKIERKGIPTIEIDINPIVKRLYKQKDYLLKSSEFKDFLINNTSHKRWSYNPISKKIDSVLKEEYTEKHSIKSFKFNHYEGYVESFVYTEYCPLKKRKWKSGFYKDKPYAKVYEDCRKCEYNLGIGEHEIIGSKTGIVHSKENAIFCLGHMHSKFKTDLLIAVNKIKKTIK